MAVRDEDRGTHHPAVQGPAPTLSVTVLNYNYAHYQPQCLDSILSQKWTDFELMVSLVRLREKLLWA